MIYYCFGLLALGLVFILLEVFIPSLGILGLMAALSIVGGGVLAFIKASQSIFISYVVVSIVFIPVILFTALKLFPKTPIGKYFSLNGPSFNPRDAQAVEEGIDELINASGQTLTALRPAGIALIEGRRWDVVTRGEMVEKGVTVEVVKVEGNRIVVESRET